MVKLSPGRDQRTTVRRVWSRHTQSACSHWASLCYLPRPYNWNWTPPSRVTAIQDLPLPSLHSGSLAVAILSIQSLGRKLQDLRYARHPPYHLRRWCIDFRAAAKGIVDISFLRCEGSFAGVNMWHLKCRFVALTSNENKGKMMLGNCVGQEVSSLKPFRPENSLSSGRFLTLIASEDLRANIAWIYVKASSSGSWWWMGSDRNNVGWTMSLSRGHVRHKFSRCLDAFHDSTAFEHGQ
jgi:hypothetical protein